MIIQKYRIIGTEITFDSLDSAEAYARKNGVNLLLEKIWEIKESAE